MKRALWVLAVASLVGGAASVAGASHSWLNGSTGQAYHWKRSTNPISIRLVDSVTSAWDASFGLAKADWSLSSVIDLTSEVGSTTSRQRKKCAPASGKVRVCNAAYGKNGWLGVAEIWISGGHILYGRTRLNDSYYSTSTYNKPEWRNLVMCQEVGHTFGLGHQDENFGNANLGSCMDYTNKPATNQHPNVHDYEHLEAIYGAHLDGVTSSTSGSSSSGQARHRHDNDVKVEREGDKLHVTWIIHTSD